MLEELAVLLTAAAVAPPVATTVQAAAVLDYSQPVNVAAPAAAPTLAEVRYASSTNTIYVSGAVTATLSQINTLLPKAPLTLVDAAKHIWYLQANLTLQNGAVLSLHGSSIGGDVDQLRLQSRNASGGTFVVVQADWGAIDVNTVKVTSWDDAAAGPDTKDTTNGRAYSARLAQTRRRRRHAARVADGYQEQRYRLSGLDNAESYGLSWKVNGTPGTNFELYDKVNVYGDVLNNNIHNNYHGMYTFGAVRHADHR